MNVVKVGNCTVVIHRPELTDEERKKREDAICNALIQFGKKRGEQNER